MRVYNCLTIALLLLLFVSCRKELPFPDVDSAKTLVINSAFTPDKLLEVHVAENCHITDTICELQFLADAVVVLKDQQNNVLANLIHQGNGIYSPTDVTLEQNTIYNLEVSRANDPASKAIGQNKIPNDVSSTFIELGEDIFDSTPLWTFEVEIDDDPNEENYYLLSGYFEISGNGNYYDDSFNEQNGWVEPRHSHFTSDLYAENKDIYGAFDYVEYGLRSVFLPDSKFNGTTHKSIFGIRNWDLIDFPHSDVTAHITVRSVSKEMYLHHKSIEEHLFSSGSIFSEPTSVYTNISNGLGIFAGYTQKTFTIELPESEYKFPSDILAENEGCTSPCEISFIHDGGSRLVYNWEFGDGGSSEEIYPVHTYQSPGNYLIEVMMTYGTSSSGNITTINIEVN